MRGTVQNRLMKSIEPRLLRLRSVRTRFPRWFGTLTSKHHKLAR
jgi:hypothetical protein